jgi:GNAT superfamily N-acetyltransferase
LSGETARRRLPEVVCVARRNGKIAGVSSVYQADVELLGGRRFWIYRSLLDGPVRDQGPAMIRRTFAVLEGEFDRAPGSPIGLCLAIADPAQRRRRPDAEWLDPRSVYAGYLADGRQVRVAYFEDALIGPPVSSPTIAPVTAPDSGSLLPSGYRISPFAEQGRVSAQDVVDLWVRENVLAQEDAERRVSELLLVATDPQHNPVGVSTTYLQRNAQLRAELWHTRVFVAAAHRRSGLAIAIAAAARDHLVERYRSGADPRGIGVLFVVESEILKRFLPQAVWPRTGFTFVGEDIRRSHIRVYYFPGAPAPEPN